jgi:acetyl-CoA acetyltransferase
MREVDLIGLGMTRFAKHRDRGLKDLGAEAIRAALDDAGVAPEGIQAAWAANAVAGLITGQETIRGQVVLRAMGLGGLPVVNVENACAGSSTALWQAWMAVASGLYDCVLAFGVEKMTHPDKARTFQAIASGLDVEWAAEQEAAAGAGETRSIFMDTYAEKARRYLAETGATERDIAWVSAKNHVHGALNPYAQYRFAMTPDEVLADRMVAPPLTRSMCSPIADGAAAVVVATPEVGRRLGVRGVRLRGFGLASALAEGQQGDDVIARAARAAWEQAGLGPDDVDVVEAHDATASAELMAWESLGLCGPGEAARLVAEEATRLGGRIPVNPSGGLECRGHPVGATGLAQVVELGWQLRGEAGDRQVEGARVGVAQNAGGHLGHENAVGLVTVLSR